MKRKFPFWLKCGIIAALIPVVGILLGLLPETDFVDTISHLIDVISGPAWIVSSLIILLIGAIDVSNTILGVIFGGGEEPWTTIISAIVYFFTITIMFLFGALVGKLIDKFRSKKSR